MSLWVQTRSAAARDSEFSIKVVQMWEKYLKGTFPEVLIPVIEVPHLGVKQDLCKSIFLYLNTSIGFAALYSSNGNYFIKVI